MAITLFLGMKVILFSRGSLVSFTIEVIDETDVG